MIVNVNLVNRRVNLHVNLALVQNSQCLCGLLTVNLQMGVFQGASEEGKTRGSAQSNNPKAEWETVNLVNFC